MPDFGFRASAARHLASGRHLPIPFTLHGTRQLTLDPGLQAPGELRRAADFEPRTSSLGRRTYGSGLRTQNLRHLAPDSSFSYLTFGE
jgi:hypothetical protein